MFNSEKIDELTQDMKKLKEKIYGPDKKKPSRSIYDLWSYHYPSLFDPEEKSLEDSVKELRTSLKKIEEYLRIERVEKTDKIDKYVKRTKRRRP